MQHDLADHAQRVAPVAAAQPPFGRGVLKAGEILGPHDLAHPVEQPCRPVSGQEVVAGEEEQQAISRQPSPAMCSCLLVTAWRVSPGASVSIQPVPRSRPETVHRSCQPSPGWVIQPVQDRTGSPGASWCGAPWRRASPAGGAAARGCRGPGRRSTGPARCRCSSSSSTVERAAGGTGPGCSRRGGHCGAPSEQDGQVAGVIAHCRPGAARAAGCAAPARPGAAGPG